MPSDVVRELRALLSGLAVDVPGSSRHRHGDLTVRIIARRRGRQADVHVHVLGPVVEPSHIVVRLDRQPPAGDSRRAEPETVGHWVARDVEPGIWTMQIDEAIPAAEEDDAPENLAGWPSPTIDDLDPRRRIMALDLFAEGPEAAAAGSSLRRGIVDPAPAVRARALGLLTDRDPDDLMDVLLEALIDPSVQVQQLVSTALIGRLRPHHLERIAVPLLASAFHAGPTLIDAVHGIGGVAAAVGVGLAIASESARTRAAAVRRLPSVSPLGSADVGDRIAAGSMSWVTVEMGSSPVEVHLPPNDVIIGRRAPDTITVAVAASESSLSAVWIGGATDAGWVVVTPEIGALELTIDPSAPLIVGGVVSLDTEMLGRPEWLLALASTLDRRVASDRKFRALLDDRALPQAARAMLENSSRNVLGEASVPTRRGSILVDVLRDPRARAVEDRPSFDAPVAAALARLALARMRERTSRSRLWSLDELAAGDELAALDADIAPDPPIAEVIEALSELTDQSIAEGGARLHDELEPFLTRVGAADAMAEPIVDVLRRELALSKEFEAFTRERSRQVVVQRQAAVGRIVVGPDVHVAGLVSTQPVHEDQRMGNVREVRITIDSSIGRHYAQLKHLWPAANEELDTARVWQLWFHIAGFTAAYPADRVARAADREVLATRMILDQHIRGLRALLADQPPEAPRLYVGYIDGRTPFSAVRMTPELDGLRLKLGARIALRSAPLVVALEPSRTQRAGALANALTFAHQAPDAAAEVVASLAQLGSVDELALRGTADWIRANTGALALDGGVTPSMWAIRIVHSARERASAAVLEALHRSTPASLAGRHDQRARIDELLDSLHELDGMMAL